MLFALLFNQQDELIAAAPAVFQYSAGESYWDDCYMGQVECTEDCQTAYVEVQAPETVQLLFTLETDNTRLDECRQQIDKLTGWDAVFRRQAA